MHLRKFGRPLFAAAVLVAGGLTMWACKGSGSLEANVELVDQKAGVKVTWSSPAEAKVEKTPGTVRVDVGFTDANGNPVAGGATGVTEGQSVPIPAGATTIIITGPSGSTTCTGCTTPGMAEGGNDALEPMLVTPATLDTQTLIRSATRFVYGIPTDADISGGQTVSNLTFSMIVQNTGAMSHWDIYNIAKPIVVGGPGTAVPTTLTIWQYVRMVPLISSGVAVGCTLVVADVTTSFDKFNLSWNGTADYATISTNSTLGTAANGWKTVSVTIPSSAFNVTGTSSNNGGFLQWTTNEDLKANSVDAYAAFY